MVKRYEYQPRSMGLMDPEGFPALISVKTDFVQAADYDAAVALIRACYARWAWFIQPMTPEPPVFDMDAMREFLTANDGGTVGGS